PPGVAGKPDRPLHAEAVARTGARRPLVVGDRLDTDIEGAANGGADSLLVLTRGSRPADAGLAPPRRRAACSAAAAGARGPPLTQGSSSSPGPARRSMACGPCVPPRGRLTGSPPRWPLRLCACSASRPEISLWSERDQPAGRRGGGPVPDRLFLAAGRSATAGREGIPDD